MATTTSPPGTLSATEESLYLATVIGYMGDIDPERKGVLVRDVIAGLYPPKKGDRRGSVREAIEKLIRTFPGRVPESVRLGHFFRRREDQLMPGGGRLRRANVDDVGTIRWTVIIDPNAPPPIATLSEGPRDAEGRRRVVGPIVDDTPGCRQLVEQDVGQWLVANASKLPDAPAAGFEVVSATAFSQVPGDLALRTGTWVCVLYTKDTDVLGGRVRIDIRLWNAIGQARQAGADIWLSFCSHNPSLLSFDKYDRLAWTPESKLSAEDNWLSFGRELLTSVANFKEVVPHIQVLRSRSDRSTAASIDVNMTKFQASLLRLDPDLSAACERGWLLTHTRPEDGLTEVWSRRCESQRAIDLYACVFSTGHGHVPGGQVAQLRLDLFASGLRFSDVQVAALLDQLLPHLSTSEHQAIQPSPCFLSIRCPATAAETVGAILYEAALRLRPKRLRPAYARPGLR